MRDHMQRTIFHRIARGLNVVAITDMLRSQKLTWINSSDQNGDLPIHSLWSKIWDDVLRSNRASIESLLHIGGTDALTVENNAGHTPFHLALKAIATQWGHWLSDSNLISEAWSDIVDDVTTLLEYNPNGLKVHNSRGDPPLFTLIEVLPTASTSFGFERLLDHFHESVLIQNPSTGELPLHRAVRLAIPAKFISVLAEAYPEAASRPTHDGWLPLHISLSIGGEENAIVPQLLLEKFAGAGTIPLPDGTVPLMYAALQDCAVSTLFAILKSGPEVLPTSGSTRVNSRKSSKRKAEDVGL